MTRFQKFFAETLRSALERTIRQMHCGIEPGTFEAEMETAGAFFTIEPTREGAIGEYRFGFQGEYDRLDWKKPEVQAAFEDMVNTHIEFYKTHQGVLERSAAQPEPKTFAQELLAAFKDPEHYANMRFEYFRKIVELHDTAGIKIPRDERIIYENQREQTMVFYGDNFFAELRKAT